MRDVVVVGGGLLGWSAAAALRRKIPRLARDGGTATATRRCAGGTDRQHASSNFIATSA